MPITPKRMPFLDHIAELRWRILVLVGSILVLSFATYPFAAQIFNFLMAPIKSSLPSDKLFISGPFQIFTFRFKISLWAAIVVGSPIIVWQILAFFVPALKPKERKWFLPTFIALVVLFAIGFSFCYYVILEPAFAWMLGQKFGSVEALPFAEQYANGVMLMLLAFGLSFEVPIVIFYLIAFGVVPYKTMRQNWRYAYVLMAFLAAVGTPDWSPITMGALAIALIILYELSLFTARVVFAKRIKAQQLAEASE